MEPLFFHTFVKLLFVRNFNKVLVYSYNSEGDVTDEGTRLFN